MKSDQEILDDFGKTLIDEVFDNQYRFIRNKTEDLAETEGYKNLFSNMTETQKKEIEHYTYEMLEGALFDFLRIFEENPQFKLYYEKDGQKMLKSEPLTEEGWIARFSKELRK
jgi:hypothetical protein